MPKIQRANVPRAVIEHLALRVRQRRIPIEDLVTFAAWADRNPTVPSGRWFKRFKQMTVCGEGELVLTILEARQTAVGTEVL